MQMQEDEIITFKQYYSPNRILVVTYSNKLKQLHCPFPVSFKEDTLYYKKNEIAYVHQTGLTKKGDYVFKVDNQWFHPKHFKILCFQL
jgi:hypothetical protein